MLFYRWSILKVPLRRGYLYPLEYNEVAHALRRNLFHTTVLQSTNDSDSKLDAEIADQQVTVSECIPIPLMSIMSHS